LTTKIASRHVEQCGLKSRAKFAKTPRSPSKEQDAAFLNNGCARHRVILEVFDQSSRLPLGGLGILAVLAHSAD
jgi:hypothetical protein